ncbi:MAG: phosphatidate cytidylyltransferase [Candidatus Helarchaeota archaeon]|nr:phosphatidate cytidylyltransferase [Candidatus Helarchaeota archaeon]
MGLAAEWYWLGTIFEYCFAFFGIAAAIFFFLAVIKEKRARLYGWLGGGCAIWMFLCFALGTAGNTQFGVPARGMMGTFQLALSSVFIILGLIMLYFAFDAKNNVEHKESYYSCLLLGGVVIAMGIFMFIPSALVFFGPQDYSTWQALLPYYTLTFPFPYARITLAVVPLVIFVVGLYVIKERRTKKYETDATQELDRYQKTVSKLDLEISRKIYHVLIIVVLVCYLFVGEMLTYSFYDFTLFDLPQLPGMADPTLIWDNIILKYALNFREGHLVLLIAVTWVLMILLFTDVVRLKKYRYYPMKMLAKIYRDKERRVLAPHVYLTAGILFSVVVSDRINLALGTPGNPIGIAAQIVMMTVMISALADAIATIIGVTKGTHHLKGGKGKKTWEGWIAGFVSAIVLGFLSYMALMPHFGGSFFEGIMLSLVAGVIFALIDFFSPPIPISDNILNPVIITLSLWGIWLLFFF